MSRAVIYDSFGGPEVLEVRDIPEPHPGPGEVRVRVTVAGLNPMDWFIASTPELASRWDITLPAGFGSDFAGVIDKVGDGVADLAVGTRVFGAAIGRAIADYIILPASSAVTFTRNDRLFRTPDGIGDEAASTLVIAGLTAVAALEVVAVGPGDTVLIGGAAGGVGVFAVQLARLAGALVIGTASESAFDFLRELGAEPVAYGDGLANRVRALAPGGVTAATDLYGTEVVEAALALGVPPERISTIAAGFNPPGGARPTGGGYARPGAMDTVTSAILAGSLTVPIAATFPVAQIREAVALQAGRHVHGKVVVTL